MRAAKRGAGILVFGVASALVLVAAASCVDLGSLSAGGERPADGSADGGTLEASVTDPCVHVAPPAAPAKADGAGELPPLELAISKLTIDEGAGFDLDGVCTCDTRPSTAAAGGSSCRRPANATSDCDPDGGADNALAILERQSLPTTTFSKVVTATIGEGKRTLLFVLSKYNGLANDDDVAVGLELAIGLPEKGCPSSTQTADGGTWRPGGCGEDTWTVAPDSVVVSGGGAKLPVVSGTGFVRSYHLVAHFEGKTMKLPFSEARDLPLVSPVIALQLVPLGTDLRPRDPSRAPTTDEQRLYRVDQGTVAGRLATSDVLELLGSVTAAGAPFCTQAAFTTTVRPVVCAAADVTTASGAPASASCDALSGAAFVEAVPARAGVVGAAPAPFTGCDAPRARGDMTCP